MGCCDWRVQEEKSSMEFLSIIPLVTILMMSVLQKEISSGREGSYHEVSSNCGVEQ